ncbi:MAG: hypothetical protein ACKVT0_09815 [Planctomycetaceae bacterium]
MANQAYEMLVFLRLAYISEQKGQRFPRDKFLLLTAASALQAGYPEISSRCHQFVLRSQPSHLISHYATFAEAFVDAEFQPYLLSLKRFCPFEQAEFLLQQASGHSAVDESDSVSDESSDAEFDADETDSQPAAEVDTADIDESRCAELARQILDDPIWQR